MSSRFDRRNRRDSVAAAQAEAIAGRTRIIRETRIEILAQLDEALKQITLALASASTDAARWSLANLQKEVRRAMDEFATDAGAIAGRQAGAMYQAGLDIVDKVLAAASFDLATSSPQMINTTTLSALRGMLTDKIKAISLEAADKINTQLGLTVMGAQTPFQAMKAVQGILKEPTRDRAVTIVRTELGRTFSTAQLERLRQAAELVPGMRKQWRRSGKIHSRVNHDLIDGQVREIEQPFVVSSKRGPVKLMCPHDPKAPASETVNCGCVMLPLPPDVEVSEPGRKAFTAEEIAANPMKADLEAAINKKKAAG